MFLLESTSNMEIFVSLTGGVVEMLQAFTESNLSNAVLFCAGSAGAGRVRDPQSHTFGLWPPHYSTDCEVRRNLVALNYLCPLRHFYWFRERRERRRQAPPNGSPALELRRVALAGYGTLLAGGAREKRGGQSGIVEPHQHQKRREGKRSKA